jgi:small subunit ribosomal protein S4e
LLRDACSQYKLCRVVKSALGPKGVPYLVTHDGRTIRYPQPDIYVNDTAKVDIESGRIVDSFKFEVGQVVMITGGHNVGCVGQLIQREKHIGSYEIAHIKDTAGKTFSTRASNVFIIGEGNKASITLPKGKGIKLTILEEAAMRS